MPNQYDGARVLPDDMPDALSFAAYEVGADGNVRQLSDFSAACAPAEAEYQWIRIVLHRNTGAHEALENLNLPPIVTQALLAHETQPRFKQARWRRLAGLARREHTVPR